MTVPARPRGAPAGKDRAPAPAGRRRGLRAALTAAVAVGAAAVAVIAGVGLVRSAGAGQPVHHGAAAKSAIEGSGKVRPGAKTAALPPLSATQLAGQRVIYSYTGLTPPANLLRWIRAGKVAGVIFFGSNISSQAQLATVAAELKRANASPANPMRHYPLLLMTDQEGGLVRRLPGAPDESEKQIGEGFHPAVAAKAAGRGAGQNLTGAGLNVNLAPVLDVYRTPGDFDDQFGRSYSTSAHKVSYLGADFIKAQQATGVAATAKHFPGLGAAATAQNTDEEPVTLNVPLATLRGTDEYPYRAVIRARVKLVMVSWAIYPALDPRRPAGLSSAIVGGELRQRLGFTGVTITDALEAGALKAYGTTRHRATVAAGAGMDLILCSAQRPGQGYQARIALSKAYRHGSMDTAAFRAAVQRILTLRASLRH
ncbi:MAG TPA: glycoside hydrolase family 3 N-terminal domain-containing protein [Streptosporangiaceae bacterium]|nr:glycoside hydrolase family 3 N-terminal domain-containing protein [Streptosporangiaceae bacterium]